MDIQTEIKKSLGEALKKIGIEVPHITLEHPAEVSHGDFATNIALSLAKQTKSNPRELAEKILTELIAIKPSSVEKIEIAGPGFINFHLARTYFTHELETILKKKENYGTSNEWRGKTVLVEYTDPNPFKEFHIGHLMSNSIGESFARLIGSQGAKVRRMCYQGDVGMHVAKTMWSLMKRVDEMPSRLASLSERTAFLGSCYVEGSKAYDDAETKKEIEDLNKKIFEGKDRKMMKLYKLGRKWSLAHFEELYKKLGTKFNYYVLESEVIHDGMAIVNEYIEKGIFEKSDGAIVFKGEKYNPKLHTRVFVSSQGLPTYEAKELGLNTRKWKKIRPDTSIIVTANEQDAYFKVVLKAFELILPEAHAITQHISHGMLRFADGKMSSRTGKIITGESLIHDVEALVLEKLKDRDLSPKQKIEVASIIAVAAIKYSILKQATTGDIVYDFEKSISFEGDSGPYLLYTAVRAQSILEKAQKEKVKPKTGIAPSELYPIERQLSRFGEVLTRAAQEKAPHHVATYLVELSSAFNAWYAQTQIVSKTDTLSPYKVAVAQATRTVLESGLNKLGMQVPEKM